MDPVLTGAALLWLAARGRSSSSSGPESKSAANSDGAKLVARANQSAARLWVDRFREADATPYLAGALARWAGIESSGNPTAVSNIGERGLLQATKTTALKDGAISPVDWDALIRPTTTAAEHARIAVRFASWLWQRAGRLIDGELPKDQQSAIWYAKLYHQRPVDLRDAHAHGPALSMARVLAERWKGDPAKMHRLRAANVVAFGKAEP